MRFRVALPGRSVPGSTSADGGTMKVRSTATTAVIALVAATLIGSPAEAATTAFANCTALHKVYKYGVATSSYAAAHAKPAKTKIKAPKVSSSLYSKNKKMDRDKDGVACEVSR
jgi:hypothetical protein